MSRPVLVEDLLDQIADLERRLYTLETTPQLAFSSIKDGALVVLDAAGVVRVRIGKDGSDYGVKVYDAAGANAVSLATLAFGIQAASNAASGTRAIASYGDLTGGGAAGPSVTVNVGPSGRALVSISCQVVVDGNNTVSEQGQVSFAVSGATTLPSDNARSASARLQNSTETGIGQWQGTITASFVITGLNPGSTTFKMEYQTNSGTVSYSDRTIVAQPY